MSDNTLKNSERKDYKMVILGDAGVGKSSIAQRFINDRFDEHQSSTLGGSFFEKEFNIDNVPLKILLWDTAGQEKYAPLARFYYTNTQSALVVFDITDPKTFDRAKLWVEELYSHAPRSTLVALAGNKTDLNHRRVTEEEAMEYAKEKNLIYFETSAKDGFGIDDIFVEISKKIINQEEIGRAHV